MTVLEALQQTVDEAGNIVIPVGCQHGEEAVPGTVTEATLRSLFGAQLDLVLPLTQEQYDALAAAVPGQWGDNWAWFRDNAVITVA